MPSPTIASPAPAETESRSPLWRPSPQLVANANLTRFVEAAETASGLGFSNYDALWRWSVEHCDDFWRLVWSFGEVIGDGPGATGILHPNRCREAQFFPEARLNFAENLLRRNDSSDALVFWDENRVRRSLTWSELQAAVSVLQQALKSEGVGPGDRVAGLVSNLPEAVIAMLAATSLGAISSSCSPDFGVPGVLDRFGQIEPKILFCVDSYSYNGKRYDVLEKVAEISSGLPCLERIVVIPGTGQEPAAEIPPQGISLWTNTAGYLPRPLEYTRLPFNHPLYILFSSGTTGPPKCIVHGAGGTLLSTSRNTDCTATSNQATGSSTSPPAPG